MVSTWVLRSKFVPDLFLFEEDAAATGDWSVEFLNGAEVVYPNTPTGVWLDFFNSSSKGSFIYYRCKVTGREYDLVREGHRTVTAKHRKVRDVSHAESSREVVRPFIGDDAYGRRRNRPGTPRRPGMRPPLPQRT